MHPALSVIMFTSLSGMGYGALMWLAGFHLLPNVQWLPRGHALALLLLAGVMVAAGLSASVFHLGHPERAWRAFSQWRSSWLSREGVVSSLTFLPMAAALALMLTGYGGPWPLRLALLATALGALATVYTTAMIYVSLAAIPAWANVWVKLGFPIYALASGGVLALAVHPVPGLGATVLASLALLLGLATKLASWRHNDRMPRRFARESALGLTGMGQAATFDRPHAQANYLEREMAFTPDPAMRAALRWAALLGGFVLPLGLLWLAAALPDAMGQAVSAAAALVCLGGMLAERRLFFAEAKHVMRLYYDLDRV
ncbi:MAG: dimethyl sulfoxide reductase anchor subunit [Sphingomonadales bacterium]